MTQQEIMSKPNYTIRKKDCIDFLHSLPSNSIDLVITDPAYESLEKYRKIGTRTRLKNSNSSSNEWFPIFHNERFPEMFLEIARVLKKDSHFYMFCDCETMFVAKPIAEVFGFKFWKPIVWDKMMIGMGYHYRARYEFILFFEQGKRKLNNLAISDILSAARIKGGYPTEKPVKITEILINQSTEKGEIVCDPFLGSGSVGVAAMRNDRDFLGCDVLEKAVEIAGQRLTKAGGIAGQVTTEKAQMNLLPW